MQCMCVCVSLLPSDDASLFICSAFLFPALFLFSCLPRNGWHRWIQTTNGYQSCNGDLANTAAPRASKILNGRPFHSLLALVFACHSRKTKEKNKSCPSFPCASLSLALFYLSLRVSFFYMCISLPSTSSGLDTHTHTLTHSLSLSQTLFFSLSILFIALYLLVFRFFSVFFFFLSSLCSTFACLICPIRMTGVAS